MTTAILSPACLADWPTDRSLSTVEAEETKMRVPGKEGLKVLRMKMGMDAHTAGVMVLGWITCSTDQPTTTSAGRPSSLLCMQS